MDDLQLMQNVLDRAERIAAHYGVTGQDATTYAQSLTHSHWLARMGMYSSGAQQAVVKIAEAHLPDCPGEDCTLCPPLRDGLTSVFAGLRELQNSELERRVNQRPALFGFLNRRREA